MRCVRCTSATPYSVADTEVVLRHDGVEWRLQLCTKHAQSLQRVLRRWTVNATPVPNQPLTVLKGGPRPVPSSRNHPAGKKRDLTSVQSEERVEDT